MRRKMEGGKDRWYLQAKPKPKIAMDKEVIHDMGLNTEQQK